MIRIRVEYDKYTRAFKLLDREFGSVLEDGAQYELVLPLECESATEEEQLYAFAFARPLSEPIP